MTLNMTLKQKECEILLYFGEYDHVIASEDFTARKEIKAEDVRIFADTA